MNDPDTLARLRRIGLHDAQHSHLMRHLTDPSPNHRPDHHPDRPPEPAPNPASGSTATARPTPASAWWRVIEVHRETLLLHDGLASASARVRPELLRRLQAQADALAVGDWVHTDDDGHGGLWVGDRPPPLNQISRRLTDGRDKVERVVIVSNVDVALAVMGLDADFNLRRLLRTVSLIQLAGASPHNDCGIEAGVVLTKADLCPEAELRLAQVRRQLPEGVQAVAVAGDHPDAAQALAPWLQPGHTLVLLGASGAGKSTLTNTLCGAPVQATGGNRQRDGRGRHTTTARSLHLTAEGACVIDTPGLRTLRMDTDAQALAQVFGDIGELAQRCRFRNCRHEQEPGCAVRESVDGERMRHFHKLERDARRDSLTALERQRLRANWKARGRAGKARALDKRRSDE